MSINPNEIPPQMRRYMDAKEPESLAAQEKRVEATDAKLEREMHQQFATWLHMHAQSVPVPFVHARTDKPSTIERGWWDFTVLWQGKGAVCIEFKMPGNSLDEYQVEIRERLTTAKIPHLVAYDVPSAMQFVREKLFK